MLSNCSSSPVLNELEMDLMDAGKNLLTAEPHTIHILLQKLKNILSKVEQTPSESTKNALHPVTEALVAKELVTHPDLDVNISLSCCFCEILRISAPDSPYDDRQLKDLFEVVVTTFDKLASARGGCYTEMGRVLELFSRNGLFVLMLDLQLDGARLILRLFKHFLTFADHQSNTSAIVLEMKKIMTLIIEESVELGLELVDLLVTLLKDMNQIASCDCGQPGEEILMNFAARLKPCFSDTGRNMSDDCSMSVASICETQDIKTKCLETETEVKRKRKRENCPLEKQVAPYEDNGKICVQGYEVKQSSAQILEAIFKKYGDIAAYSIFQTSYVTSLILEVVCEIVKRVQTNEVVEKLDETERQLSDAEMANIDVTWLRAHLQAIRGNTEVLKRLNLVKKTTKDTLLAERVVQTDLSEADAEVVAARKRVERAELLVNQIHMAEQNCDEKILECKARLDSWVQPPFP